MTLGEEQGLRQLVSVVFEKAHSDYPEMFGDWVVDKKTQIRMYTYFVAAMISEDFEWMSTSLQVAVSEMQINEKYFEDYMDLFQEACKEKNISKGVTELLIEKLGDHRKRICINEAPLNLKGKDTNKNFKRQATIGE